MATIKRVLCDVLLTTGKHFIITTTEPQKVKWQHKSFDVNIRKAVTDGL